MKLIDNEEVEGEICVAPLAGAWIEMVSSTRISGAGTVAPLAGAWIEIPVFPAKLDKYHVVFLVGPRIDIILVLGRSTFPICLLVWCLMKM